MENIKDCSYEELLCKFKDAVTWKEHETKVIEYSTRLNTLNPSYPAGSDSSLGLAIYKFPFNATLYEASFVGFFPVNPATATNTTGHFKFQVSGVQKARIFNAGDFYHSNLPVNAQTLHQYIPYQYQRESSEYTPMQVFASERIYFYPYYTYATYADSPTETFLASYITQYLVREGIFLLRYTQDE